MIFSSFEFLFYYLPVTLLVYYLFPARFRNPVLFFFSILFYGWGEPVYVLLMLATLAADWFFGLLCGKYRERNPKRAKLFLVLSCVFNLGILGFFKYWNFLAANLSALFGQAILPTLELELPIGISFYTFQAMSYVIDVYRGDVGSQKNPLFFGTYVALFPQLIAGPVVRYKDVERQLEERSHSVEKFAFGVRRFVCGLTKKVVLADMAGDAWRSLASIPDGERGWPLAWLGILFFTFQIYFDFSAYSDMAIGLGRMIGFEFCENFNYPYTADSVTDFWRRWHISLSTWFRDYVYIPLGGNRVKVSRHIFNLLCVWLLTGLWHGADWCFILWGVYYGVLLVLEKYVWGKALKRAPAALRHGYALLLILFGWFIFVSPDLAEYGASPVAYAASLFSATSPAAGYELLRSLVLMMLLAIAATPYPARLRRHILDRAGRAGRGIDLLLLACGLLLSFVFIAASDYSPFLYTRF